MQYPLHILNIASVQDVASHFPKDGIVPALKQFDALRFRANIYGKCLMNTPMATLI
jgi:hypothetical protein